MPDTIRATGAERDAHARDAEAAAIDAQRDEHGLAPGEIMPGIADPFRRA